MRLRDARSAHRGGRHTQRRLLVEPSGGVRQHGVDLAGVRREVIAHHRRAAVAARNILQEPLEFVDVLLDGLPELGIGAVLAANFIERLLTLGRVEATGE